MFSTPISTPVGAAPTGSTPPTKAGRVARPKDFAGKKGSEVYRWIAQLRLQFGPGGFQDGAPKDQLCALLYDRGRTRLGNANLPGSGEAPESPIARVV